MVPKNTEFLSSIIFEVGIFILTVSFLSALAYGADDSPCTGLGTCIIELIRDREFHMRCGIAFPIACLIGFTWGTIITYFFPREVKSNGVRPPVWSFTRWDADVNATLIALISGTPMIQLFHHASDKFGESSGMRLYKDPLEYGLGWALLQIPIYLLLWDFAFYVLHRWVLHHPLLYKPCHSSHHAFRPPTGWSGAAVGPLDIIFEGVLPYMIPLFLGIPFNEYTVFALNALINLHGCFVHSACHWEYGNVSGILGYILVSPIGHNKHHQYGLHNACNFAPIFKHWDRILGTLNESEPFWWSKDRADKKLMKQPESGSLIKALFETVLL